MDPLVPPHVDELVPYSPGKPVEELERELGIRGAVKLASNESPMGPSPKALDAIHEAAAEAHRYPDADAHALRKALALHHGVAMDDIAMGNGSNELIDLLCRTFATPDDHAVFGHPSFVCYELSCRSSRIPFTAVPLHEHIAWDVDALIDAVTPATKLLFIANPNNPTGAYVPRADLERLLRTVPERVLVVVDEAYVEFADASDYTSALDLRALRQRLVVLRTFSKAHGLAAMRVGYAIAPGGLVQYLNRLRAPFNVGSLAQRAALASLDDPEHLERYIALNRDERARVSRELEALGLRVAPSQANFVLVDTGREGREVYDQLLRMGVIVRAMPPPVSSALRITIGLPEHNDRMLSAMRRVLRGEEA